MFYSGLPIQEEQKYVASQYLPALANLQGKYATQKFGLNEALTKLAADQSAQAYDIQDKEKQLDLQRQLADEQAARDAAARASAGSGSGGSPSFGSFGGNSPLAPASSNNANNPNGQAGQVFSLIQSLRQQPGGVQKWNWGALANEFKKRGIDTAHGSAADLALNAYFNSAGNGQQTSAQFLHPTTWWAG